jgi:hypothetical protein
MLIPHAKAVSYTIYLTFEATNNNAKVSDSTLNVELAVLIMANFERLTVKSSRELVSIQF